MPDTLSVRFRNWRNKTVANPIFQAWCTRIPGIKQFSQNRANALYRMTSGFVHSQILFSSVNTGILDALKNGPQSITALQALTSLEPVALHKLLRAAESLDLIVFLDANHVALDDLGAVAAHDAGIKAMIEHHALFYRDLVDPVALLKNRSRDYAIAQLWAYSANPNSEHVSPHDAHIYSELMRLSQQSVVAEVLASYSFSKHKNLLDVGGGTGAFVAAIGAQYPQLKLHVFDLPAVADEAKIALDAKGLQARATTHGGSFFKDEVPAIADCYSLIRVLYDHDDDAALLILKNIRNAMGKDDILIIAEPMGGANGPEALVNAYFTFYLLAMASGACRSAAMHTELLRKAGFSTITAVKTGQPLFTSMLTARI